MTGIGNPIQFDWDVQYRDGVWLPQVGWWLDARHPVERAFVSHAHFDHLARHAEVICSPGTARLMAARLPSAAQVHPLPFGQTEALTEDVTVTLWPAGHILGSAQIVLEHAGRGRLLYSGDFKLRPGRSSEAAATPAADVLIMETTFGRPHYRFPPTATVLAAIAAFCRAALEDGEVPVLFGYSLGKSQELLCGLAEAGLPVMVHPQTARLTRLYQEMGVVFPAFREFDGAEVAGHVVLCPPQSAHSAFVRRLGPRRTAVLTGWALDPGAVYRYQCDAAFPLSDHADYEDLLRYVEAVGPRRVLTLHGFAADFARTLRARGYEAWALTEANQFELALEAPSPPSPRAGRSASSSPASSLSAAAAERAPAAAPGASAFAALAETAEAIRGEPGKGRKVARLSAYLRTLGDEDAARAALFLTGRAFPQSDARVLNLGGAVIRRAVLEATGLGPDDFARAYLRCREGGEAVEALLEEWAAGRAPGQAATLADLAAWLDELAAARGPLAKIERLAQVLRRLTPAEGKYLVKITTGDLRIGLKEGLVEEAIAQATDRPLEAVRRAQMLGGDTAATVRAARRDELEAVGLRVFHPVQCMLASPEPTAGAIVARLALPVWLEDKYDGIRCQLHKAGERVELFSRDLRRITEQFPDLARAVARLPGDWVLDGELLAWRGGRALPFAELQRRLGRGGDDFFLGEEIPVVLSAFDLLWQDGRSLLAAPLDERRRRLESALAPAADGTPILRVAPRQFAPTEAAIDSAFREARARGNEGLMAKDPASPYTPGRRGLAWLKLKQAWATLDVVVVGVEYGHGKRRDVLSDYTFAVRSEADGRLLTIGKAYSGLTDAEIAALTTHFLSTTLDVRGRYRTVVPDTVLEVAFDSIHASDRHASGLALRFPRIARLRPDKSVAEIDTLAACQKLAGTSGAG